MIEGHDHHRLSHDQDSDDSDIRNRQWARAGLGLSHTAPAVTLDQKS